MTFFRFGLLKTNPPKEAKKQEKKQAEEMILEIQKAQRQWKIAQHQLDQVCDPELIDCAVYRLKAAERQYMYLLKRAGKQGIHHNSPLGHDTLYDEKRMNCG